jgi:hypothetical protein
MMTPTRERLICFDRDGISNCGFPSSPVTDNGSKENSHASMCATISPYDAEEELEFDTVGETILKADWYEHDCEFQNRGEDHLHYILGRRNKLPMTT